MTIESGEFKEALGRFATGVTIVTGVTPDGKPVGATVNAFSSLSLDPPLILICLAKSTNCLPAFTDGGHFAVNILEGGQEELSETFASQREDKFKGVSFETGNNGVPVLSGCLANLICARDAVHEGGDHLIIVGRIERMVVAESGEPLLYYRGAYGRPSGGA